MPAVRKKLMDGIDQYSAYYSVICVFGSVVGCVVVPLITQSIESIIFSAILISLTAKTLHSRSIAPKEEVQDERRRGRESSHEKKPKRKKVQQIQRVIDVEAVRRQREVDLLKMEEQRRIEREQKLEEKRQKKALKREERLRRKEEEERERLKEEQQRREREERRSQEKKEKEEFKKSLLGFRTLDSIESLTRQQPVRRERKNSSSSSGSSRSTTGTQPHRRRQNSRYSRASSDSNLSPPLSLSPSPTPHHPPMSQMSLAWQASSTQSVQQKHDISGLEGTRLQKVTHKKRASNTNSSPATLATCNQSTSSHSPSQGHVYAVNPLAPCGPVAQTTEKKWSDQVYYWPLDQGLMPVQCYETMNLQENASLWVSGPHSAPGNLTVCPPTCASDRTVSTSGHDEGPSLGLGTCPVLDTSSDGSCYSLFSGSGQSLFGSSLLAVGVDDGRGNAGGAVASLVDSNAGASPQPEEESPKFDEWPVL